MLLDYNEGLNYLQFKNVKRELTEAEKYLNDLKNKTES